MSAKFSMGRNCVEIFDFWCNDRESNDPYGTEFKVRVCSNGEDNYGESEEEYVGTGSWMCGIEEVRNFVGQLDEMNHLQGKHAEIKDVSDGGRLCFDLDRMGHVQVSGTLFGVYGIQSLKFEFTGDQTALGPFLDGLRECLRG